MKIIHFTKLDEEVWIKHINVYEGKKHYIKSSSSRCFGGSLLPSLCMSAATVVESTLFIYGGFHSSFDRCSSDLFRISMDIEKENIEKDTDEECCARVVSCIILPGDETKAKADYEEDRVSDKVTDRKLNGLSVH